MNNINIKSSAKYLVFFFVSIVAIVITVFYGEIFLGHRISTFKNNGITNILSDVKLQNSICVEITKDAVSLPAKNASPKDPSYRDIHVPAFDRASYPSPIEKDPPPGYEEYEPLRYSDQVTMNYSVVGLRNFSMGEEVSIFVDTHGTVVRDSVDEFVRVLFYGISVFCPRNWIGNSTGVWQAKLRVMDPGLYRVHIESTFNGEKQHRFRRIAGSPFTVLVRPADTLSLSEPEVLARLRSMKPKLAPPGYINYPSKLCSDASWRHGRWVRCFHTPEPCIRTGWVWVPNDCYFRVLSRRELLHLPKPLWIVFAGSSVQRGSFLALVDLMLENGAANLTQSRFWRCWGWMDLSLGALRVSYLDFRTPYLITRQNEAFDSSEPNYPGHAMLALSDLGQMDGGGPDLFYMEETVDPVQLFTTHVVKSWLGPDWRGRFMVHLMKACASMRLFRYKLRGVMEGDEPAIWRELAARPQLGIEAVDEAHLPLPLMHDQEQNMWEGTSLHFHRRCDRAGMHSCSAVADAVAQQVLNAYLFSPRPHHAAAGGPNRTRPFTPPGGPPRLCLRCPTSLVPFTIRPDFGGLKCHDHFPLE